MNIEDIKVGETYNVRVKVESIDEDGWLKVRTSEKAISFVLSPKEQEAFSPLPKYDPCRPFKEGDRVKPRKLFGRCYSQATARIIGKICTVIHDEIEHYTVSIRWDEGECNIDPAYLELVTPVEELEPYSVRESDAFDIVRDGKIVMTIPFTEDDYYTFEQAKAEAEDECDRLNAEYRKELE